MLEYTEPLCKEAGQEKDLERGPIEERMYSVQNIGNIHELVAFNMTKVLVMITL